MAAMEEDGLSVLFPFQLGTGRFPAGGDCSLVLLLLLGEATAGEGGDPPASSRSPPSPPLLDL